MNAPLPAEDGMTLAWFVVWTCGCSDTRPHKTDLPTVCPGHGSHEIEKPEQLPVLTQYAATHLCDDTGRDTCPNEVTC